jgi:rhodanese-related sulfurtransferase
MNTTAELSPNLPMREILVACPGARRALFRLYHIGGCSSCGFSPEETLAEVCARNDNLPPEDVLAAVLEESAKEEALLLGPLALASELTGDTPPQLIDIRTAEEFAAVHIPGSRHLTQPLMQELLATQAHPEPARIVLVDHRGERSLDAAAYFIGHGLNSVRALRGGIDAWSTEVNPELPRYTLE